MSSPVLILAVSAFVLAIVSAQPCGVYQAQCGAYYNGTAIGGGNDNYIGHLQFDGLYAGNYTWLRSIFANTTKCSTFPSLHISMGGAWIDMGDMTGPGGTVVSNLYMTSSVVTVVAGTQPVVQYLQGACPCGITWVQNKAVSLQSCPPGTCPDTTWLGGSPKTLLGSKGYILGDPFYAVTTAPVWGVAGSITISYIDAVSSIAWDNDQPASGNVYNGTACIGPITSNSICGTWNEYCSPSGFASTYNIGSITGTFTYEGPTPTGPTVILAGDAGTYTLSETLYSDTDCSVPYINVQQQGVLAYFGTFTDSTGLMDWEYKRNAQSYQITPLNSGAVQYLVARCACTNSAGNPQSWSIGNQTVITTCPNNDCDGTLFLHGGSFGQPNFGGAQIWASKNFSQIRLTELSNTTDLQGTFTDQDYPFLQDQYCAFSLAADRWCGKYARECTVSNRGDGYDFTESVTFETPSANGVGIQTRNYQLYDASTNCGDAGVVAISVGATYTVGKPATTVGGGYNYEVVGNAFHVLPQNAAIVAMLNANCACGGTWATYTFRNIFGCTSCNVPFISTFELSGQPAYTNILVYPESLRYGNWSNVSSVGYATPIGITNFPLVKQDNCTVPVRSNASKFPGGGVFLILLFVPLTIYFLVGAVLSYRSTGALSVPHKEFWTSLPGLVVAGLKFSFVEFFGLRGASPAGYTPQTNKPEGYGTLGE